MNKRASDILQSTMRAVVGGLLVSSILFGVRPTYAQASPALTAADYARAERFLSWNKDRYVANADIQHHWIGSEDRFWYRRTNAAGGKEFIVVNAATGAQTPAFDQKRLAASLSKASNSRIEAGALPFDVFHYTQNKSAIQFQVKETHWTCQIKTLTCVQGSKSPAGPGEVASPDGKWAAYIRDRNLWARATNSAEGFALTTDGEEHYDYARPPTDPVTAQRAPKPAPPDMLWSSDSNYILTSRLDERKVKEFFLIQSTPDDGSLRPKLYRYRIPLPGDENLQETRLLLINMQTRQQTAIDEEPINSQFFGTFKTRHAWWSHDNERVYFLRRDRFSRSISLNMFHIATGQRRALVQESGETPARNVWGDPMVRTLANGDVIWYSDRDGWGHLYYYEATGALRNPITRGEWLVRSIVKIDEAAGQVYFMASGREKGPDPYQQHLYRSKFDGSGLRLLTPEAAEHQLTVTDGDPTTAQPELDSFSPSGRYFVASYSSPELPPVFVLRASDGRLIKQLEKADLSKLREGGYRSAEPFQVLAADGKTPIYGNLFRPSSFDATKKYPVIDANYSGPHMIRTGKSFALTMFHPFEAQSLAELGFIVITIDGRGTPQRSKAFLDYSYGRLAKTSDLEDHIAGMRQLAERYPYMDLERVGIDGVSGGGFAAAYAILKYPDFYKVAVSAEGDHDVLGQGAVWGETYNGPVSFGDYKETANQRLAANLKGKLLLMHGEMDDRVLPTQTLLLADALIKENKDFDLLIIPNANHDAFVLPYFIRKKWDYFVRHLLGAELPANYSISNR